MRIKKYYWKAVVYDSYYKTYKSITPNKYFELHYKLNEPTIPLAGKLFVFNTKVQAKNFISNYTMSDVRLFNVTITGTPTIPTTIALWSNDISNRGLSSH